MVITHLQWDASHFIIILGFAEHETINSSNVCSQLKNQKKFKIDAFKIFEIDVVWSLTPSVIRHTRNKERNITFPEKFIWSKEETTGHWAYSRRSSLIESPIIYSLNMT